MKRLALFMVLCAVPFLLHAGPLARPTVFIANTGQWPSNVLYGAAAENVNIWITRTGMILGQQGHTVTLRVIGATGQATTEAASSADAPRVSFLRAGRPAHAVPTATSVLVRNVRPGIHIEYVWDRATVRYNILVDNGTHLPRELFTASGADAMRSTHDGFVCSTPRGEIHMRGLYAYAGTPSNARPVRPLTSAVGFGFDLSARMNNEAITVDPIVSARTLNGAGSDEVTSIGIDRMGNIVAGGWTTSLDLNVPLGGAAPDPGAGRDGFVACYSADLSRILAFTYIAGNADDAVRSLAISPLGDIWVTGETSSTNIPVSAQTGGTSSGTVDGFVLRLSSDLSKVLGGRYLAGNKIDNPLGIICGDDGSAVVCGQTTSTSGLSIPTGYDVTHNGEWDAFAIRFDKTCRDVEFFSYFGTPGNEAFTSVAVGRGGSMAFTGWTSSNALETFPRKTRVWVPDPNDYYYGGHWEETGSNAYDVDFNGGLSDAFVVKFDAIGQLVYSTFLGGNAEERGVRVLLDAEDRPVIVGTTRSTNLPLPEGSTNTAAGGSDVFMMRLSADGLRLSTCSYFGGGEDETAGDAVLDATGNVIVTGSTTSSDINALGVGSTPNLQGGVDGFIATITQNGTTFASLFGWAKDDVPLAMARDRRGDLYIGGRTSSPIAGDTVGGTQDAFVAKWAYGTVTYKGPTAQTEACVGTPVTISWSTEGLPQTTTFEVESSTNGGSTWTSIASGLTTRSHTWTVPTALMTEGKVRLRVVSMNGHIASMSGDMRVDGKPVITNVPASVSVCPGSPLVLDATVEAGSPTYQWRKDGEPIAGATARTYSVPSATTDDAGTYELVATTTCGSTTTSPIAVSVRANPMITEQPKGATVGVGQVFTLRVVAEGAALTYQWDHNGTNIPNATANELVITATQADAGEYRCTIGSACGTVTSDVAVVVVGTVSVDEEASAIVRIAPQPAQTVAVATFVTAHAGDTPVDIVAADGTRMTAKATWISVTELRVDVSALAPGLYALIVGRGNDAERQLVRVVR